MLRSAFRPLGLLALPLAVLLAACAAPAPADTVLVDTSTPTVMEPTMADNGVCPELFYTPLESTRQNFSLAAEYYRNANTAEDENIAARLDAFCAADIYLTWLVQNDPLFTGGDPDDRNFLRLANVYEFYSTQVSGDSAKTFLDQSLDMRERGEAAMAAAGVSYDKYPRDLLQGYFFYSYADVYDDASQRQYDAFNRAFTAQPDSLEDWYLGRLVELSAELTEDPMERADYLETLVPYYDNAGTGEYLTALIEYTRTPPPADAAPVFTPDAIADLVTKYKADSASLTTNERLYIFSLATQQPELIVEAGGDADAIQDRYFDEVVSGNIDQLSASQLFAVFVRSWKRGDRTQAESYFNSAISKAGSNGQRADFYYGRAVRGYGSKSSLLQQALSYQSTHGPTLYTQAQDYASGIGRPSSVDGRAAYWCLADRFNSVAATGDPRVASTARRAAAGYNRAGPSSEDYFFKGWTRGQSIRASSGSVSCTTRVR